MTERAASGLELEVVQPPVGAVAIEEFGVPSPLHHPSRLHDDDLVRLLNRREPVGDHEDGPALEEVFDGVLDLSLIHI